MPRTLCRRELYRVHGWGWWTGPATSTSHGDHGWEEKDREKVQEGCADAGTGRAGNPQAPPPPPPPQPHKKLQKKKTHSKWALARPNCPRRRQSIFIKDRSSSTLRGGPPTIDCRSRSSGGSETWQLTTGCWNGTERRWGPVRLFRNIL
jgi:hypothetical protein